MFPVSESNPRNIKYTSCAIYFRKIRPLLTFKTTHKLRCFFWEEGERSETQNRVDKDDLHPFTKQFIFGSLHYLFADKKYLAIQLSVYLFSPNKFE